MDQFSNDHFTGTAGDDTSMQRVEVRDSLFLVAGMRIAGQATTRQVRVRNLSAGGMMAELADQVEPGTRVEIDLRGVGQIGGRIAWWTAGRVGIAFDEMIDPMAARKPISGGTKTPVFVKPILPIL